MSARAGGHSLPDALGFCGVKQTLIMMPLLADRWDVSEAGLLEMSLRDAVWGCLLEMTFRMSPRAVFLPRAF